MNKAMMEDAADCLGVKRTTICEWRDRGRAESQRRAPEPTVKGERPNASERLTPRFLSALHRLVSKKAGGILLSHRVSERAARGFWEPG